MNPDTLHDLIKQRLVDIVDQAYLLQNQGMDEEKQLMIEEGRQLASLGDEEVFYMTYHRYHSPSYGLVFEIEHGDDELKFGGI